MFDGNAALLDVAPAMPPDVVAWPNTITGADPAASPATAAVAGVIGATAPVAAPLDFDLAALEGAPPPPAADAPVVPDYARPFTPTLPEPVDLTPPPGDSEPIFTLDFDSSFDPFGTLPDAPLPPAVTLRAPEPEAEQAPHAEAHPAADADIAPAVLPYTELDYDLDHDLSYADVSPAAGAAATEADSASDGPATIAPAAGTEAALAVPEAQLDVAPIFATVAEPVARQESMPPADPTPVPAPAAEPEAEDISAEPLAVPTAAAALPEPVAHDVAPADIEPAADAPHEPAPDVSPGPAVDEHLVASAVADDAPLDNSTASVARLIKKRTSGKPRSGAAPAAAAEARPVSPPVLAETDDLAPAPAAPASAPADADLPGFVRQARRRERMRRTLRIVMLSGSVVLLGTLTLQGMTTYRNQLATQVPALKPVLVGACAKLGCQVALPAQIDQLTVEQGELQSLSATTFSYATVLRNQSGSAQAWPDIELTLNDGNDQPVLRRVLAPRDYLAPAVNPATGFGARSEQPVHLNFSLADLKAAGYHIAIFYP